MENQLSLLLAHSLIGVGFFFIYIFHVRSIFESRTNVAYMSNQLERETLFRREDALYYGFYKTIVEEPDFWIGYEKLSNLSNIEYPNNVNVLKRFEVLPELLIGYFYHYWRYLTNNAPFPYPFTNCWRSHDVRMPLDYRECDIAGQPMQFYLEMVWLLGGMTVFLIYIYGMFLSEHLFGGIYSVVSYFMFHKYASKIYDRPLARENFAFPFIFLQMLYVTTSFGNMMRERFYKSRLLNIFILTWVTSIALATWQFSSVIFIVQIAVAFVPWAIQTVPLDMYSKFASNLAFSHLLANFLAFLLTWGNRKYLYAWTIGPSIGLLAICYSRKMRLKLQQDQEEGSENYVYALETQPLRFVILGALTASTVQGALIDIVQKWGIAPVYESTYTLYRDLFVHWILPARINFVTSLAACNPQFDRIDWVELLDLVKTLFVKPYCMYGVVMLAEFFRKWRKNSEKKTPNADKIERSKKYVLEDFLEDNHISMREMSNKETEDDLNKCLKLLEECNYDYDKYKLEKCKLKKSSRNEHDSFLNDIKELKEEINAINTKSKKKKKSDEVDCEVDGKSNYEKDKISNSEVNESEVKEQNEEADTKGNNTEDHDENPRKSSPNSGEEATKKATLNSTNQTTPKTKNTKKSKTANNKTNKNGNRKVNDATTNSTSSSSSAKTTTSKASSENDDFGLQMTAFHYLHSFIQMGLFTFLGLCFKKLFFLCFTQGCVIAPTICSKWCFRRNRNMFWTISLTVFLTSIVNPGIVNIREEYFPSDIKPISDDLDTMLEWIKLNTERDAVFAGPIEIIGTVHMTTKRAIVNHAHLEMRQILERTEHAYSVYSRQQSSDIYNQYSQMRVQYLIINLKDCTNVIRYDCDLLQIWDDMQPAYRKYPQFCYELMHKNVPSFLRVFSNDYYAIIKLFSQSVQINLRHSKMPEKVM